MGVNNHSNSGSRHYSGMARDTTGKPWCSTGTPARRPAWRQSSEPVDRRCAKLQGATPKLQCLETNPGGFCNPFLASSTLGSTEDRLRVLQKEWLNKKSKGCTLLRDIVYVVSTVELASRNFVELASTNLESLCLRSQKNSYTGFRHAESFYPARNDFQAQYHGASSTAVDDHRLIANMVYIESVVIHWLTILLL